MGSNLRNRAHGNEIARTQTDPTKDLQSKIGAMTEQFQLAMPRGAEATQLVRDAMTVLRQTPKLAQCDPQTVLGALMTCAQLGLRVGVLGHAWVLPFKDKHSGGYKAELIIGYQGLVELAHRSDRIASLIARTIYANEEYDVSYGLDDRLVHKPVLQGDKGEAVAYYAIVKLVNGGTAFIFMTKEDAEAHRDAHAMARTKNGQVVGPWRDNFDAMAMKTCIIKLSKWMPKSTDLARAIEADGGIRVDVAPDRPVEDVTHQIIPGSVVEQDDPAPSPPPQANPAEDPDVIAAQEEVLAAGRKLDMDLWSLEVLYSELYDNANLRDASLEDLAKYLLVLHERVSAAAQPQGEAAPEGQEP